MSFTIESPPPLRAICSTVRGFAAVGVVLKIGGQWLPESGSLHCPLP